MKEKQTKDAAPNNVQFQLVGTTKHDHVARIPLVFYSSISTLRFNKYNLQSKDFLKFLNKFWKEKNCDVKFCKITADAERHGGSARDESECRFNHSHRDGVHVLCPIEGDATSCSMTRRPWPVRDMGPASSAASMISSLASRLHALSWWLVAAGHARGFWVSVGRSNF